MSRCPQCGSKECCGGDMQAEIEALQRQLADCRAVLQKAGHLKECHAHRVCGSCNHVLWANLHNIDLPAYTHDFVVSECTCGYARVMGEG